METKKKNKEYYEKLIKEIAQLFSTAIYAGEFIDKKPITVYNNVKFLLDTEMDKAKLKGHRENGYTSI